MARNILHRLGKWNGVQIHRYGYGIRRFGWLSDYGLRFLAMVSDKVRVYSFRGMPVRNGRGLFASAVMRKFPLMPVEEEGRLHDVALRENYIERVFAYARWQETAARAKSLGALVQFHSAHKFLLLAHSDRHYRHLGRLVAEGKQSLQKTYEQYGAAFMEALAIRATVKKHANVLEHVTGYFSPQLLSSERAELVD